jgi:hypothetical protein
MDDLPRPENRSVHFHRPSPARIRDGAPRLLIAGLALVCLGSFDGSAYADGVRASTGFDAKAHQLRCHCRTCRGESCCCGRKERRPERAPTPEVSVPANAFSRTETSSCLKSTPCGGEGGMPDGQSSESGLKAILRDRARHALQPGDRTPPLSGPEDHPPARASRIDEPPEVHI